jgi:hypothetical protein
MSEVKIYGKDITMQADTLHEEISDKFITGVSETITVSGKVHIQSTGDDVDILAGDDINLTAVDSIVANVGNDLTATVVGDIQLISTTGSIGLQSTGTGVDISATAGHLNLTGTGVPMNLITTGALTAQSTGGSVQLLSSTGMSLGSIGGTGSVLLSTGVSGGVQQVLTLQGDTRCLVGTGTGGGFTFPPSSQPSTVPEKVTTSDSLDLVLTNAAGSARTDAGTAGTLFIRKRNNIVTYSVRWGNINTFANAVAAAAMTFNETVPVRFRGVNGIVAPQAVTNNAALSAGVFAISTAGVITVNPTYGFGTFTNGANCNVFGNCPACSDFAANV